MDENGLLEALGAIQVPFDRRPYVYALLDAGGRVLYVGKSTNLMNRHARDPELGSADRAVAVPCRTEHEMERLEAWLISRWQPGSNIVGNPGYLRPVRTPPLSPRSARLSMAGPLLRAARNADGPIMVQDLADEARGIGRTRTWLYEFMRWAESEGWVRRASGATVANWTVDQELVASLATDDLGDQVV